MEAIKKYALLSLVGNTISLVIYLGFFHQRQAFKGEDGLATAFASANMELTEDTRETVESLQPLLKKRPVLQDSMNAYFKELECATDNFYQSVGNLPAEQAIQRFEETKEQLFKAFEAGMWACHREAKLKTDEVEAKIMQYRDFPLPLPKDTLLLLPQPLLYQTLILNIKQLELVGINNFAGLVGRRFHSYTMYFPIVLPAATAVRLGEPFKAKLGIGGFSSEDKKGRVFVEGEQVELNSEGKGEVFFRAPSVPGKKRLELVLEWNNPTTKRWQRDTTHYDYWAVD